MFTFEIGKKYFDTSACDHNCVFVIEITKRTAKTVTFLRDGKERRAKIHTDDQGEYIIPERYSMAPVFRASQEYVEAPMEEAPAALDPVAAYIPQVLQAAPQPAMVMVGQPVLCDCGAMFPPGWRRHYRLCGERGHALDPRRHHGRDPVGGRTPGLPQTF